MAFLAALLGGAGGAAASGGMSGLAAEAGAAGAAGAGTGSVADAALGGTTAPITASTPTGGLLDWWKSQPQWARDSLTQTGLNALTNPRPLPTPAPMNPTPMSMPSPMGQPPIAGGQYGGADMSAMAPFLQALARGQRFGSSPYVFGGPGNYFG